MAEPETAVLQAWLAETTGDWVSSDLARAELTRAVRRVARDELVRARVVLDSVILIEITTAIFEEAGRLEPEVLRTLDAVHLAAALALGDDLEAIVTYDERLAAATHSNGIASIAPR